MDKQRLKESLLHSFHVLLLGYLLLILLDTIKEGFVSDYMNMSYLFIILLILGLVTIFITSPLSEENEMFRKIDYIQIFLFALLGGIIILIKTKQLGWVSYLISLLITTFIILFSFLTWTEKNEQIN